MRQSVAEPPVRQGGPLLGRWFLTVTAGEFLGFCVPVLAGALTAEATPTVGSVPSVAPAYRACCGTGPARRDLEPARAPARRKPQQIAFGRAARLTGRR